MIAFRKLTPRCSECGSIVSTSAAGGSPENRSFAFAVRSLKQGDPVAAGFLHAVQRIVDALEQTAGRFIETILRDSEACCDLLLYRESCPGQQGTQSLCQGAGVLCLGLRQDCQELFAAPAYQHVAAAQVAFQRVELLSKVVYGGIEEGGVSGWNGSASNQPARGDTPPWLTIRQSTRTDQRTR